MLDTNVPSEVTKPEPHPKVWRFLFDTDPNLFFISVLSYGELWRGVIQIDQGRKKRELERWLAHDFQAFFGSRILPVTQGIIETWAEIKLEHHPGIADTHLADMLIAATALAFDFTLVTRNVRHFSVPRLQVYNPWEDHLSGY